jgi:hypothetical protein
MRRWTLTLFAAVIAAWPCATQAQQFVPSPRTHRSPAEIAAKSELVAEQHESCRLQAKERRLHLLKRRRFMRECMKN